MNDYLKELQRKIPIGMDNGSSYIAIFTHLFRNGATSIINLAYHTHIPSKILIPAIDNLIEQDILNRIEEGVLFTEDGMKFVEEKLKLYGTGIQSCFECERRPVYISPRWEGVVDIIEKTAEEIILEHTSTPKFTLFPESALQRALYLYENGLLEGKNVGLIEDTGMTALAIYFIHKGVYPDEPYIIPNLLTLISNNKDDEKIIEYLSKEKIKGGTVQKGDLDIIGKNQFDTLLISKFEKTSELQTTLNKILTQSPKKRPSDILIFMIANTTKDIFTIQKLCVKNGYLIKNIESRFDDFDGLPNYGDKSQMLHLQYVSTMPENKLSTLIQHNSLSNIDDFDDFQIYYCKACNKTIVLKKEERKAKLRQLYETGCPYCNETQGFSEDGSESEPPADFSKEDLTEN